MNRLLQLIVAAAITLAGCASRPEASASSTAYATCHVCEYNNDLACVRFRKKEVTPTLAYHGQSYSFCSEDCRSACAKDPDKYLRAKQQLPQ